MRKTIALSFIALALGSTSCVTSTPQRGTNSTSSVRLMSVEAEARQRTESMSTSLNLSASQKDDVMVANTLYYKILKNLKDNKETSKNGAAKESYMKKIKSILTTEQYSKFETEMGG
ncbi:MAG: hypothetical protein ACI9V1_001486 [Spirosomataceae bacterium]|jgi:hypothetical protein